MCGAAADMNGDVGTEGGTDDGKTAGAAFGSGKADDSGDIFRASYVPSARCACGSIVGIVSRMLTEIQLTSSLVSSEEQVGRMGGD